MGKSLGEGKAGAGEAEGIGSESAGASGKGRGATTRGTMGMGKTSETGRDSEVVEKNGESSKKVTSAEIKYL